MTYTSEFIFNIPEINNIIKTYKRNMMQHDRNQKAKFKRKYNKVINELKQYNNRIEQVEQAEYDWIHHKISLDTFIKILSSYR